MPEQQLNISVEAPTEQVSTAPSGFSGAEDFYASLAEELEKKFHGSYIMINSRTLDYVIGRTASGAHAEFIEKFGDSEPGWCTRIGASAFASG